jgi:type II secretory pathway component PulF
MMGNFVINFGPVIGLSVLATFVAIFFSFPKWTGKGRGRADRLFPWTTYRSIQSGFLLITIAAMSRSGMNMAEIIRKLIPYATPYMRSHLEKAELKLKTGNSKPTEALDTGLLPEKVIDRLEIYSVLPDFSKVMDAMGKNVMKKMDADFSKLSASINIAVMLLAAAFIVFTLAGIGMAALQLSDAASAHH